MTRKILPLILTAILAGCGSSDDPQSPSAPNPSEATKTKRPVNGEETATKTPASGEFNMQKEFEAFIQSPGRDAYLALRKAVMDSDRYNPYSNEMSDADELIAKGEFAAARKKIISAFPNLLLSPQAHLALAYIADHTDDRSTVDAEAKVAAACAEGVMATGDGSEERPYQVVRTSDEHDVLRYMKKEFASQSLTTKNGRRYDVLQCRDGQELWFDVTEVYEHLQKQLERRE